MSDLEMEPEGGLQLEADYSSMVQESPEAEARALATLEEALEEQRKQVEACQALVDSKHWDYLYGAIQEAVVGFEQKLASEAVPLKIYRAQGAASALRAVVNTILDKSKGVIDPRSGLTLQQLEEQYEREVGRS